LPVGTAAIATVTGHSLVHTLSVPASKKATGRRYEASSLLTRSSSRSRRRKKAGQAALRELVRTRNGRTRGDQQPAAEVEIDGGEPAVVLDDRFQDVGAAGERLDPLALARFRVGGAHGGRA
jgi:hypothetical protein